MMTFKHYWVTLVTHSRLRRNRYFVANMRKLNLMVHVSRLYLRWFCPAIYRSLLSIQPWSPRIKLLLEIFLLLYLRQLHFLSLSADAINCILVFLLYIISALDCVLQFCPLLLYHVNGTVYDILGGLTLTEHFHLPNNLFLFSHIFRVFLCAI
jgi:hypothetical protein